MRSSSPLLPLFVLALAGCGQGNFAAQTTSLAVTVPPLTGFALEHAYGDSITFGVGVPSQSQTFVALAAAYNSLPLTDRARSGDEACDLGSGQLFPNNESPTTTAHGLYSLLIGTTDADVRGPGPGETIFNTCHQALLSWLATPVESKLLATSPSVITSGPTQTEAAFNWNALVTNAQGATISFPFTRTVAAPLYLWYRILDTNPGTFTCALDGALLASLTTAPPVPIQTANGTGSSFAVLRAPGIPAGSHKLTCTQTSPGTYGMGLLALGGPPPPATANAPRLLAGLLSLQLSGGHASTLAAYNADVRANATLFAADGLDIELFDAAAYMTGTSADMSDALHPNTLGQQEIFKAFEQTLN